MAGDRPSSRAAEDRLPVVTTLENTDISVRISAIFAENAKVFYNLVVF
jgi:hypothetical protein